MKASDLFVQALENEGVEFIFGIPGEENLDFLDSLRNSSIKLVVTRHEQAAGFMAATYGRLTGKAGVCLSTLGPGATNLVTPAAYAQLGAMPMLMITGQKPIKSSKQGHFQILDVVDMMLPLTKYTKQIASGRTVPSRVREAIRTAEEERPGAVHLELPEDIAREIVDEPVLNPSHARRPIAEHKAIDQAVKLCGDGCNGAILEGTLLENVPSAQPICRQEAFGPVAVLEPFEKFDDALHAVNDSDFGLQAGLFTRDLYKVRQAWDQLEVGGVVIGDVPSWRVDNMPYGGVKDSGLGREGIRFAMEDMTEIRLLVIRTP